jgi:hypothetical protein
MNAVLSDQGELRIELLALGIDLVHRMPEINNPRVAFFFLNPEQSHCIPPTRH